ncbi:MAG: DUF4364 family protein [Clostridia bacterium]|nr:DUF4364 family protein [Clostridia bacterium]
MAGGQREGHRDKLTLLYALLHIGKCTEEQLIRFNDACSLMEQFQFYVSLGELKDAHMVREEECLEGKLLSVTEEGKKSLELFLADVWPSAKIQIDNQAKKWKRQNRDEQQMPAEWVHTDAGYVVTLRLLETGNEIFNLTLTAADDHQAAEFCRRWPRQAAFIYRTIMEKLGEANQKK